MSEWISIREKMPKKGQEVLTAAKYNDLPLQAFWDGKVWKISAACRDELKAIINDATISEVGSPITHWQPLPELPMEWIPTDVKLPSSSFLKVRWQYEDGSEDVGIWDGKVFSTIDPTRSLPIISWKPLEEYNI